ncbi:hypothetical protein EVAR_57927_1 [Eumeta japonica]|uniref:Uncharacterized protein n=1 Tax=Eumeta variegata TaxID=151549 RepID=A0A4C1ZPI7_EUMVA|nr:hypothetical protein EVAR_57927_1 [Eumeta japonica]
MKQHNPRLGGHVTTPVRDVALASTPMTFGNPQPSPDQRGEFKVPQSQTKKGYTLQSQVWTVRRKLIRLTGVQSIRSLVLGGESMDVRRTKAKARQSRGPVFCRLLLIAAKTFGKYLVTYHPVQIFL